MRFGVWRATIRTSDHNQVTTVFLEDVEVLSSTLWVLEAVGGALSQYVVSALRRTVRQYVVSALKGGPSRSG